MESVYGTSRYIRYQATALTENIGLNRIVVVLDNIKFTLHAVGLAQWFLSPPFASVDPPPGSSLDQSLA